MSKMPGNYLKSNGEKTPAAVIPESIPQQRVIDPSV
jgi:hypothetical protein